MSWRDMTPEQWDRLAAADRESETPHLAAGRSPIPEPGIQPLEHTVVAGTQDRMEYAMRTPRTEAGKRLLSNEAMNARSWPLITAEMVCAIEDEAMSMDAAMMMVTEKPGLTLVADGHLALLNDRIAALEVEQAITRDLLASAIHAVGRAGEGPEDRYLELNSDQLAEAIMDRLSWPFDAQAGAQPPTKDAP